MTAQNNDSKSFRSRSRQWTTLTCVVCAVAGAIALSGQHYAFGALCLTATLVLFKDSALKPRRLRSARLGR